MIFALAIVYVLADLFKQFPSRSASAVLLVLVLTFPVYGLTRNYGPMNLQGDREAITYAENVSSNVPPHSILFADGDQHLFSLWYYHYVTHPEWSVQIISPELLQFDWYFDSVKDQSSISHVSAISWDTRVSEIIREAESQNIAIYSTTCEGLFADYRRSEKGPVCQILNDAP